MLAKFTVVGTWVFGTRDAFTVFGDVADGLVLTGMCVADPTDFAGTVSAIEYMDRAPEEISYVALCLR